MIARVIPIRRLPKGHQFFDYEASADVCVGDLVSVPLRGTSHLGIVCETPNTSPFTLTASVERVVTPALLSTDDLRRLGTIAEKTGSTVGHLLSTFLPAQESSRRTRPRGVTVRDRRTRKLTSADAAELARIFAHLKEHRVASVACHRSLATFAILKLLSVRKDGEQVLILAPQARDAELLAQEIGVPHLLFTGTTTDTERLRTAQAWRDGSCTVLVATRAGSLMGAAQLSTIIVAHASNDEHENTRRNPRFDAREAAWLLQSQHDARLVFFDDLPRLEDIVRAPLHVAAYAAQGDVTSGAEEAVFTTEGAAPNDDELRQHLEVDEQWASNDAERASIDVTEPTGLRVFDLTQPLNKTATPFLAFPLIESIKTALQSQKSVLVFYNRKGVGAYYQCRACDHIPRCGVCGGVPLPRGEDLLCPHCSTEMWIPAACLNCGKPKLKLTRMGKTALESTLRELIPESHVVSIEKGRATAIPATPHVVVATEHFFTSYDTPFPTWRYDIVADLSFDLTLVHDNIRATEDAARKLSRLRGLAERMHGTPMITTYLPDLVQQIVSLPVFIKNELALREKYRLPPYATEVVIDKPDGATLPDGYRIHQNKAIGYNVPPPQHVPFRYHGPYSP